MPLYEFRCETCGPFEVRRPMSAAEQPAACPSCDSPATRVITAPNLYRTAPWYRRARGIEERSAHEPEVVTRPSEGFAGRGLPSSHHHHAPPWVVSH